MSCKKAKIKGYTGDCLECPLPRRFCDDIGSKEIWDDKPKGTRQRNEELRLLAEKGYSVNELSKTSGLAPSTLRQIIHKTGIYA